MANKKKNKLVKTPVRSPTPPPIADDDENDLMNQLLEQLDAREAPPAVQAQSAALLNDMDLNKQAAMLEAQPKMSAKDRYKARQASTGILIFLPLRLMTYSGQKSGSSCRSFFT